MAPKLDITKEQFLEAYNKHLPNAWTKFAFRYFSTRIRPEDKWLSMLFIVIESILFACGFIGTVIGTNAEFVVAVTIPFSILLAILGIMAFPAVLMNNARIRKIRKILNITASEYNTLAYRYITD